MRGPHRHDGPLAPFADGYRDWLLERGYTPSTVIKALIALGHLGRWMGHEGIDAAQLDDTAARKFVGTQVRARGRLRIDYGDPRQPEKPVAWLWKFIDGAKTAGELYGRALVVIAAEQHASRLVVPASQRTHPTHWSSHKDLARKALAKLAAPHLPASLKALEAAVAKAHRVYEQAEQTASRSAAGGRGQGRKRDASQAPAEASENTEVSVDVESVYGQEPAA